MKSTNFQNEKTKLGLCDPTAEDDLTRPQIMHGQNNAIIITPPIAPHFMVHTKYANIKNDTIFGYLLVQVDQSEYCCDFILYLVYKLVTFAIKIPMGKLLQMSH